MLDPADIFMRLSVSSILPLHTATQKTIHDAPTSCALMTIAHSLKQLGCLNHWQIQHMCVGCLEPYV